MKLNEQLPVRLAPHALDLEQSVLGALLLEKDAIITVSDILSPETFYDDRHKIIYAAIYELNVLLEPVDILTITAQLRKQEALEKIGGAYYITQLTDRVASSANIGAHARLLLQMFMSREVIRLSTEAQTKAYEYEDVFDIIDSLQTGLHKAYQGQLGREYTLASDLVHDRLMEMEKKPESESGVTGIASLLSELDGRTRGWQKTDLIIVAGRTSMGKTIFMLHCARAAAIGQKIPVGVISLEMSKEKLMDRMISAESGISMSKIKQRNLTVEEFAIIHSKVRVLETSKILIDDTGGLTLMQIRAKAMRMKQMHGIGMLFIDYLGLIQPAGGSRNRNRANELGEITRGLKSLAKELDIPVMLLSQLNRDVESRDNNKPRISDLRESGDIEQDADQVILLHRPERYGKMEDVFGSTAGKCYLIIAKFRDGELGEPAVRIRPECMQLSDLEPAFEAVYQTPNNFIIRPSRMKDDDEDYAPF